MKPTFDNSDEIRLRSGNAHRCPLRSGARGWGPAVPTEIWSLQFYLAHLLTFFLAFLSGVYSDRFSGILSGIYSDILSGKNSGILSDILPTFFLAFYLSSDCFSGILSGTSSDVLSGILIWHILERFFWHSIRHIFWHSFWQKLWHPIWHSSDILSGILSGISSDCFSGILSGTSSDILSGILIWHKFWPFFWHSIWHIFWHSFWHILWHPIWHSFWHSIWHIFWHSICHSFQAFILGFYLEPILTVYLAFFWHSVWHSLWQSLRDVAPAPGPLHSLLSSQRGTRSWGPAVPTEIWSWQLKTERRNEKKEKEEQVTLIKCRDSHLAGGEKCNLGTHIGFGNWRSWYHDIIWKEWPNMLENILYKPSTSLRLVAFFQARRICNCSIGQKQFLHRAAYGAPQALAASNTRLRLVFNGIGFANASVFTSCTSFHQGPAWSTDVTGWQPTLILWLRIKSDHQKKVFGNFPNVSKCHIFSCWYLSVSPNPGLTTVWSCWRSMVCILSALHGPDRNPRHRAGTLRRGPQSLCHRAHMMTSKILLEWNGAIVCNSHILNMQNFYTLRTNPPARPNHFSEDIEGRVKLYIQGTLQHVSTEFLRNHEILTPLTFTFKGIFNMFQQSF